MHQLQAFDCQGGKERQQEQLFQVRLEKMTKKITSFTIKTSTLKPSLYLIENKTQTAVINNASFRILHKLDHVS